MPEFRGEGGGLKWPQKIGLYKVKIGLRLGKGGQKWPQKIGHHLCIIPNSRVTFLRSKSTLILKNPVVENATMIFQKLFPVN